ncbi:DUF4381 domain-containing protein [Francisellaceae bacterium]|nr:DUF4381 domain-containing protein [Francisellaceae bacterium]
MTKEELLSQLKGIHLPSSNQPWWDMAPGWYILDVIILLILISLIAFYFYWRIKKKIEQNLLSKVDDVYNEYKDNSHLYSSRISILLKQAVLKSTSNKSLMTLHGNEWVSYLKQFSQNSENISLLIQSAYDPKAKFDIDEVNKEVRSLYIRLLKRKRI